MNPVVQVAAVEASVVEDGKDKKVIFKYRRNIYKSGCEQPI